MKFDCVIVGVGGQGTLLSSKIMGRLAMDAGLDVKVSEVHGMSQRGGNVITHVRIGEQVYAPLVTEGEADCIVSFELLEALRALPFLRQAGDIIVNTQRILPMPVITGAAAYPGDVMDALVQAGHVVALDAMRIATECGAARAANLVMMGALARRMDFPQQAWQRAIAACVPQHTLAVNQAAFTRGWSCVEGG